MHARAQVALANDGRIFVSDGYCNARVLEFSAAGEYWGVFALPAGKGAHAHRRTASCCRHA